MKNLGEINKWNSIYIIFFFFVCAVCYLIMKLVTSAVANFTKNFFSRMNGVRVGADAKIAFVQFSYIYGEKVYTRVKKKKGFSSHTNSYFLRNPRALNTV